MAGWDGAWAAVGAVGGIAIREAFAYWRGRLQARHEAQLTDDQAAADLRDELRGEVRRLAHRVAGLETDVHQWRESYWRAIEEREQCRAENRHLLQRIEALTAEVGTLRAELAALREHVAHDEDLSRVPRAATEGETPCP
jgi:chromosome segregation ATPase